MTGGEIFLCLVVACLILEDLLDMMIPGRMDKRIYDRSMKEFDRIKRKK